MDRKHRTPRRSFAILATIGLVAAMLGLIAPAASGVANTCRARNVTQGTPSRSDLQAVIRAADPGDTIAVKHVCVGHFRIHKRLTLVGKPTPDLLRPVLLANGVGKVLRVSARVSLIDLKITGGRTAWNGGGIYNRGNLTLKNSVVSGNTAVGDGGGIFNLSLGGLSLTLNGSSSVRGNDAGRYGGGILNSGGDVTLNGSSSVGGNDAGRSGGGIFHLNDILTLNDSASVRANTARVRGGGIANYGGDVFMSGLSSVRANTARRGGGGIYNDTGEDVTLNESSSVRSNDANRGGGVLNFGRLTLKGSSWVTGNTAAVRGGGIRNRFAVRGCDSTGVDEWIGTVEPNTPNDFINSDVNPITCT